MLTWLAATLGDFRIVDRDTFRDGVCSNGGALSIDVN
jgi:hypothetical protein